jgi:hypothetical protein
MIINPFKHAILLTIYKPRKQWLNYTIRQQESDKKLELLMDYLYIQQKTTGERKLSTLRLLMDYIYTTMTSMHVRTENMHGFNGFVHAWFELKLTLFELWPCLKSPFAFPPLPFTSPKKYQFQNILTFFTFYITSTLFLLLFK